MKKLVTAACALVAASAFAVESANIVGYQQTTCIAGLNFVAPDFTQVGANTVKVGDILVLGDSVTSMGDNLQIIDDNGDYLSGYTWSSGGDMGAQDGWYNDDGEFANNETIARGLALLLSCEEDDVVVQVSGEVNTNNVSLVCGAGLNSVGNFFPAAIAVGNFVISGDSVTSMGDNLQIIDDNGDYLSGYTWSAGGDMGAQDGWYDDDGNFAATDLIDPGLGMLLSCEEDGVQLTISFAN